MNSNIIPLSKLPINQRGIIVELNCNSSIKRRLLDLGITPKTKVTKVRTAPFGDPIELSVRGYSLTMRLADALLVEVI